jgi:hypothetical protein
MQTETISLDRGGATHANVELDIGAGELNLRGGSAKLIDGAFTYNVSGYKPVIENSSNGSHAVVTVKQAGNNGWGGNAHNTWNLNLGDSALLDLAVNCGAGQAQMVLGDVNLRSLDVHMGAGQVDLDLRGHPSRDYDVNISGGVGQATVRLPEGVGIRADAHGGIGSIDVSGLSKQGDHYENDSYDRAKVNIHLKIDGGIGEIRIIG